MKWSALLLRKITSRTQIHHFNYYYYKTVILTVFEIIHKNERAKLKDILRMLSADRGSRWEGGRGCGPPWKFTTSIHVVFHWTPSLENVGSPSHWKIIFFSLNKPLDPLCKISKLRTKIDLSVWPWPPPPHTHTHTHKRLHFYMYMRHSLP